MLVICVFLAFPALSQERNWHVCLAEIESLASVDGRGAFFELFALLRTRMPDTGWILHVRPFTRGLHDLQHGRCDLHMPYIQGRELPAGMRYGSGRLGNSYFVLYSRRAAPLTTEQVRDRRHLLSRRSIETSQLPASIGKRLLPLLGQGVSVETLSELVPETAYREQLRKLAYPHLLDIERAHRHILGVAAYASSSVEASLERLRRGRIDGYIDSASNVEPVIDQLGLRGELRAELFALYDAGWLRADSVRGQQADAALLKALQPVQESGEYQRIISRHVRFSLHWEPWP